MTAKPYPDTFDGLIDEIDRLRTSVADLTAESAALDTELSRLRSLRRKVEHLAYCDRLAWPRENYKQPGTGHSISNASYSEAYRAVLDAVRL